MSAYSIPVYFHGRAILDDGFATSGIDGLSVLRPRLRRMIDNDKSRDRIGGEPRELVRRAIARLTMAKGPAGRGILSGKLPQDLAEPFMRALMRIEAELLLNDADLWTAAAGETRTQSERRADAFTAMILRLDA